MPDLETMTVKELRRKLAAIEKTMGDFKIWLSSDEEGNEVLPMNKNVDLSMAVETHNKRLIFFPDHYDPGRSQI